MSTARPGSRQRAADGVGEAPGGSDHAAGTLTVLALFEHQARTRPGASALVGTDGSVVTYERLWRTAAGIAGELVGQGVQPGQLVGVATERGLSFVAAALGVWMTGGVYLPMDTAGYPIERLRAVRDDAALDVLITSAATEGLAQDIGCPYELSTAAVSPVAEPTVSRRHSQAYVIYTSGSSGVPKGVVVGQEALLNLAEWHRSEFGITQVDRILHTAGLGFDAAVQEIWPYLSAGATVVVSDDASRTVPAYLVEDLRLRACTTAFISTPLAQEVMRLAPNIDSLRYLFTGGDRLVAHHQPTSYQLVNEYGPTECTVISTFHRVRVTDPQPPPIGLPIRGVTTTVRAASQEHVAEGEVGELYVAGANLAEAYLGRPDLTTDAFPVLDGRRWYRTGDLVSHRNGVLHYVGRVDREQLKVSGLRLEASDVEAALMRTPGVDTAACVLDRGGKLAAVVTGVAAIQPSQIRRQVANSLPRAAVPTRFVQVPALPLTANGKVDRDAVARLVDEQTYQPDE